MTVTMPDVSIDESILVLESLDFDPQCEVTDGCDEAAQWLLTRSCCDLEMGICETHHISVLEFMKRGRPMYCKECGANGLTIDDFTWTKL